METAQPCYSVSKSKVHLAFTPLEVFLVRTSIVRFLIILMGSGDALIIRFIAVRGSFLYHYKKAQLQCSVVLISQIFRFLFSY